MAHAEHSTTASKIHCPSRRAVLTGGSAVGAALVGIGAAGMALSQNLLTDASVAGPVLASLELYLLWAEYRAAEQAYLDAAHEADLADSSGSSDFSRLSGAAAKMEQQHDKALAAFIGHPVQNLEDVRFKLSLLRARGAVWAAVEDVCGAQLDLFFDSIVAGRA